MMKKMVVLLLSAFLFYNCNNIAEDEQAKKVNITYSVSEETIAVMNPGSTTYTTEINVVFYIENVYNADLTGVRFKSTIIFADRSTDVNNMFLDKVIKTGATNSELTLHKEYDYATSVERVKIENIVAETKNSSQL